MPSLPDDIRKVTLTSGKVAHDTGPTGQTLDRGLQQLADRQPAHVYEYE
jgi:hypothetical protein